MSYYMHLYDTHKKQSVLFFTKPLDARDYDTFSFTINNWFAPFDYQRYIARYSNDMEEWTPWKLVNTIDKRYIYSQVGVWVAGKTKPDQPDIGFGIDITEVKFYKNE